MIHVESLAPTLKPPTGAAYLDISPDFTGSIPSPGKLIDMTFRSVVLDGCNLWREPEDVATGQLAEAVRLADLREKPELLISNISPWVTVGEHDPRQVPILQIKIQNALAEACKRLNRPVPESRLDLSHGEYSIRCYLGRTKPTDHVYDEDFVSDNR